MRKRNVGIEWIRVLSMFMIMALHILLHGGVIAGSDGNVINNQIAWLMESFCITGVNLFGLISGYVLVNSSVKLHRLISLWAQVFTYSFVIGLVGYGASLLSKKEMIFALLPLTTKQYWYFSAYIVLCFFIPLINPLFVKLSKLEFKRVLLIFTLFFSVYGFIVRNDGIFVKVGYSPIWLFVLYLFGAYFKRFGFPQGILEKTGFNYNWM